MFVPNCNDHRLTPSHRGMGGNQSMRDCATIMPLLLDLAHSARAGEACTSDEIGRACKIYEAEMLPRSFAWVQKSGGLKPVVCHSSLLLVIEGCITNITSAPRCQLLAWKHVLLCSVTSNQSCLYVVLCYKYG